MNVAERGELIECRVHDQRIAWKGDGMHCDLVMIHHSRLYFPLSWERKKNVGRKQRVRVTNSMRFRRIDSAPGTETAVQVGHLVVSLRAQREDMEDCHSQHVEWWRIWLAACVACASVLIVSFVVTLATASSNGGPNRQVTRFTSVAGAPGIITTGWLVKRFNTFLS